jgi:hypothetical protein
MSPESKTVYYFTSIEVRARRRRRRPERREPERDVDAVADDVAADAAEQNRSRCRLDGSFLWLVRATAMNVQLMA